MTACSQHAEEQAMQSVEFQCAICFELMVDPVVGTCGHAFCKRCMDDWKVSRQRLGQTVSCPQCRTNLLPASSTQQFGVCIRLRETINKLFPEQIAARRLEVEEWDKQVALDEERARSSGDTSTSAAPSRPLELSSSDETIEAYRELTRRVLAALVTTNPEAAAEAVGLLPSPRPTQRAPSPEEQELEARQRYASLQSSMALLTGAVDVQAPPSLPQTPTSDQGSPATPPAARTQEQAAQQAQQAQQAHIAQQQAHTAQQQAHTAQQQAHTAQQQLQQAQLQAAQQRAQQQAPTQAPAQAATSAPSHRHSAAESTRERQVQAVRRQQQAHEVRGVQLARLLASLIAEGSEGQAQQQAQVGVSTHRPSVTAAPARAQQGGQQQRAVHARQHAGPRPSDAAQASPPSRNTSHGPVWQCPARNQRAHAIDAPAAQHQRRQHQQHHAQQQQQQPSWSATQSVWAPFGRNAALRAGYPCMMTPMLVPANSSWPYLVSMPMPVPAYTMHG